MAVSHRLCQLLPALVAEQARHLGAASTPTKHANSNKPARRGAFCCGLRRPARLTTL